MSESAESAESAESPKSAEVEITDSAREKAKEMAKSYEDRPTMVLPGSDGTVAGTAIGDWLDDDGNPKYSEDSKPSEETPSEETA